jgi:hypothetical protein
LRFHDIYMHCGDTVDLFIFFRDVLGGGAWNFWSWLSQSCRAWFIAVNHAFGRPCIVELLCFSSQFHLSHCPGGLVMNMSRNSSGGTSFLMPHLSNTLYLIYCRQPRIETNPHSWDCVFVCFILSIYSRGGFVMTICGK